MQKQFTLFFLLFVSGSLLILQKTVAQHVGAIKVTESNARAYRDSVKLKVFGNINFPYNWMPDAVFTNVTTLANYSGFPYNSILYPLGNLASIDQIDVFASSNNTDFPVPVHAFVFHPHSNNGKLFIYHSGHCAATPIIEDIWVNASNTEPGLVIPRLIAEGYTVLAVPMINYRTSPPNYYYCGYNNHNALFTEGHYSNPLSLFFRPLIASLNYLGRSNYDSIYMCGLSGGGWITSVYPAMDTSIVYSFPIAGAWPKVVRSLFYPNGDKEQTYPPLYNLLDTHELFVLGCLAPARKMLQVNNRFDNCCFGGTEGHLYYVDSVKKALQGTGGVFDFYLDETVANHQVAPHALQVILEYIQQGSSYLTSPPGDTVTAGKPYTYNIGVHFPLVNGIPEILQYSLLKAPSWITLDSETGMLGGTPPEIPLTGRQDTISFKVETPEGRFVLYNYMLTEKRSMPTLFTLGQDLQTVYMLPAFSHSINSIDEVAKQYFQSGSGLVVDSISLQNNSVLILHLNQPVSFPGVIKYTGENLPHGILYSNNVSMENFPYVRVEQWQAQTNYALKGMIRFNTDTRKFEYFNGKSWINMN